MGRIGSKRALAKAAVLTLAGAALLGAAQPAGADALTIGSNLGRAPDISEQSLGGEVTLFDHVLSENLRVGGALGPYFSPFDGTVVRWRIRTGEVNTGPVSLRILSGGPSPNLDIPRSGAGTSPVVTPALGAVSTYDVNMPIHRGDAIGINCCSPDPGQFFASVAGPPSYDAAELGVWSDPPLADGGPLRLPDQGDFVELAVNAEIVPNTDFIISSVKQVRKHRLRLSATFPNWGVVRAGDPRDPNVDAPPPSVPPRRGLLFRSAYTGFGTRLGDTAPYAVSLLLIPTKQAQRLLRARGSLRGKIELAYTPAFGSTVERKVRFRLQR